MLEQALEMDLDLSQLHGSAKAPREEQPGDNPYFRVTSLKQLSVAEFSGE